MVDKGWRAIIIIDLQFGFYDNFPGRKSYLFPENNISLGHQLFKNRNQVINWWTIRFTKKNRPKNVAEKNTLLKSIIDAYIDYESIKQLTKCIIRNQLKIDKKTVASDSLQKHINITISRLDKLSKKERTKGPFWIELNYIKMKSFTLMNWNA